MVHLFNVKLNQQIDKQKQMKQGKNLAAIIIMPTSCAYFKHATFPYFIASNIP